MRFLLTFLLINGCYLMLFGQNPCSDLELVMTDFRSTDIIITGDKESLLREMGSPLNIKSYYDYDIVDSISYDNGKVKMHHSKIDIEYIYYDGLQYVCYIDSVQLTIVDFVKKNIKISLNNIIFCQDLELDTLLKRLNIDDSCVWITPDWYYQSYKKMYQVAYSSEIFALSGFRFYFDFDTKKLWYADLDFINTGGIYQRNRE
ncbi:MAG TPA: hypothetical protein DEO70_06925 [Bacteroidales bacterium]|nr:hypothetical protein [Bacteroidales bacterium]